MQVNVHLRIIGDSASETKEIQFLQIPRVGEYFAESPSKEAVWYKVLDVVHYPFGFGWDAELFVVEADRRDVVTRYLKANRALSNDEKNAVQPDVW